LPSLRQKRCAPTLPDPIRTLCTPAPLSLRREASAGGSCFCSRRTPLPRPVPRAAGRQPARGTCWLQEAAGAFGRAEGNCTAPASPGVKRELPLRPAARTEAALCPATGPEKPSAGKWRRGRSRLGRGAGASSRAAPLQGLKCRAARTPSAPPAPAERHQPVSAI